MKVTAEVLQEGANWRVRYQIEKDGRVLKQDELGQTTLVLAAHDPKVALRFLLGSITNGLIDEILTYTDEPQKQEPANA